jgi:ribonucleoside-diphosphate reductase alpha chain
MAQSLMDYVFRRLALDYMTFDERAGLGIYSAEERQRHLETGSYEPVEENGGPDELISHEAEIVDTSEIPTLAARAKSDPVEAVVESVETTPIEIKLEKPAPAEAHTTAELLERISGTAIDSPLCMTCGTKMRPAGSCYVCEGCGSTSGCS